MDYTYGLYICFVHMYYTYVLCMCVFVSTFPCYDQIIVKYAYRYLDVYFAPSNFLGLSGSVPKRGIVSQLFPLSSAAVQCSAGAPLQVATFTVLMFRK